MQISPPSTPNEADLIQGYLKTALLQNPVVALHHLINDVKGDLDELRRVLAGVTARLNDVAQAVDSAATVLELQGLTLPKQPQVPQLVTAGTLVPDASTETTMLPTDIRVKTGEPVEANDLRRLLETLPDVNQLENTAKRLSSAIPSGTVTKIPRAGSRGNALLYILSRYGRNRPLPLADLVFAFETMNVPLGNAPSYHRVVSWEIRELIRRGWPITENADGFRFNGMLDTAAEGTMA